MAAFRFDPGGYGPTVRALLEPSRVPALGPGKPNAAARAALRAFDPLTAFGRIGDRGAARTCHAGLWLLHDFLNESHAISQEAEGEPDHDFWHAIMHRREPDASNSKYWWRRVGPHPVLGELREHTPALGYTFTSPQDFVDFCERVRGTNTADEDLAKQVQLLEWQLLFDHCYRKAMGQ